MPKPIEDLTISEILNMTDADFDKYTKKEQIWLGSQKHFNTMSYNPTTSIKPPILSRMNAMPLNPNKRTWVEFLSGKGKRKSRRSSNSRVHSRVHSRSKKSTRRRRKA